MPSDHLAPATREDEAADRMVRGGRNVGAVWIVGAVVATAFALTATSAREGLVAIAGAAILLIVGVRSRARYWRSARRQLGDATFRRAQWRVAREDRGAPDRIMIAIGLVMVLLAFQAWRG